MNEVSIFAIPEHAFCYMPAEALVQPKMIMSLIQRRVVLYPVNGEGEKSYHRHKRYVSIIDSAQCGVEVKKGEQSKPITFFFW